MVALRLQVKGMCTIVGNKCDTHLNKLRNAESAPASQPSPAPPAAAPAVAKSTKPDVLDSRKKAESEADKFFGITEPLSESGEPIIKVNSRQELDQSYLKKQLKIQEQKIVRVSPGSASKYMDIRPDTSAKSFATDEAVVDESEWEKAYIQVQAGTSETASRFVQHPSKQLDCPSGTGRCRRAMRGVRVLGR